MSELLVFLPIFVLIGLLVLGVPVAFALFLSGSLGLVIVIGFDPSLNIFQNNPYGTAASYLFTTIPMFILMAEFLNGAGLISQVFRAMRSWTSFIPGGLAVATTIANGGMAALSGSSTASAATMSSIAVPEMQKYGYDDRLSMGTVSASGTFAIMFPPSLGLIIYGILTETSIAVLFIAGIVPGVLTLIGYVVLIMIWSTTDADIAGDMDEAFTWHRRFGNLLPIWPAIVLIVLVLGGLYSGAVTPTEAGALGAFGAFLIGLIVYRMGLGDINEALGRTAETTTMIFMIIAGAMLFGSYLAFSGLTQDLITYVGDLPVNRWVILLILLSIYILLGMFMSQSAIMVLTLPITFPLVVDGLGFDPFWFGVLIVKTAEIGLVTPPLGINIYVAVGAVDVDIGDAFTGAARFLVIDLIILMLMLLFPSIVLWLPGTM